MHQTAPVLDPDYLYRSLNTDLQRRIEVMGRSNPDTFGNLKTWEVHSLWAVGVVGPLVLAWWLL